MDILLGVGEFMLNTGFKLKAGLHARRSAKAIEKAGVEIITK